MITYEQLLEQDEQALLDYMASVFYDTEGNEYRIENFYETAEEDYE